MSHFCALSFKIDIDIVIKFHCTYLRSFLHNRACDEVPSGSRLGFDNVDRIYQRQVGEWCINHKWCDRYGTLYRNGLGVSGSGPSASQRLPILPWRLPGRYHHCLVAEDLWTTVVSHIRSSDRSWVFLWFNWLLSLPWQWYKLFSPIPTSWISGEDCDSTSACMVSYHCF